MKNTIILFGSVLLVSLLGTGCSSTSVTSEDMADPYTEGPVSDILVIGLSNVGTQRMAFENKFVEELQSIGVEAVASSELFVIPKDKKLNKAEIQAMMAEQGNDAVIITSYLGEDKQKGYEPEKYNSSMYSQYDYSQAYTSTPVNVEHTTVYLQTNLYSAATGKLMWSGKSETWSPKSEDKTFKEVIKAICKQLTNNGLIKAK